MATRRHHVSRRQAVLGGLVALGGLAALPGPHRALAASRDESADADAGTLATATRGFGFRLLAQLTAQHPAQNTFISPPSVATVMAMIDNGARGGTAQAITTALGLHGLSPAAINQASAALLKRLNGQDSQVQLAVADSLWARQGVALNPAFVSTVKASYGAQTATLDFNDPRAAVIINNWVRQATHGKITRIVPDHIDPSAILFLVNAVYFKGRWSSPFNRTMTRPGPFTRPDGSRKTLPMMTQSLNAPYYEADAFQVIALPYGNGKISMYLFLPAQGSSLSALLARLNDANWKGWMAALQPTYGTITLPRFTANYTATPNLNRALTALGMGIAFDPLRADLSGIAAEPRPVLSAVMHRTMVAVDELGTTAAAVTSGQVGATAVMAPSFTMVFDRPFLCAIRDSATGTVLFIGSIVDPA